MADGFSFITNRNYSRTLAKKPMKNFHTPVAESLENFGEDSSDGVDYFVIVKLKKKDTYIVWLIKDI